MTALEFKRFEKKVIPKEASMYSVARCTELKPSWKDLTDGRIVVPEHLLKNILDYLEEKHFAILMGAKDTGKTWLSYAVGYTLVKEEKKVFYAQVDTNFDADATWDQLVRDEMRHTNEPTTYIILEDCHSNYAQSELFFQKILDYDELNLRFLFTIRDKVPPTFHNEGTKRGCVVRLPGEMSKEHVKNIIKKFIEVKKITYEVFETELDDVAEKWGNNLFWVWLRLISWKYSEGQKLSDITNEHVCNSIWSDEGEIRLFEHKKILFPLSALCQFEFLKVYELTNFLEDNREALCKLKEKQIVCSSLWKTFNVVSIPENVAELILETMSRKDTSFRGKEIAKQTQIFKDYLKSTSTPPNWYEVFYYLYFARETKKSDLAKEILTSLWNDIDIWGIAKEKVKDIPVGQIVSLIKGLLWVEGKKSWKESQKASEIRFHYLRHNYKNIQDKTKSSSARTIMKDLPLLSQIVELNKFFNAFKISDYIGILNRSTLQSIRTLFLSFKMWNLPSAAKEMANALPDADLDCLTSQENATPYRVGGLIEYVMLVDRSAAKRFVEMLSSMDLGDLFSREDSIAEEKGHTKVWTVNSFLSHRLSFAPDDREKIVNNIRDDVWHRLIQDASFDEGFWLLWHIHINNSNKAECIVRNGAGGVLLQRWNEEQKEEFFLPLLGILHLCAFKIQDMPLTINIIRIEQMLKELKKTYSFSWDNVPGTDNERLLMFLKDGFNIGWTENAKIRKSDDGKTISISNEKNQAKIMIDEKKEKVTLKVNDGKPQNLKAKKKDDTLNIIHEKIESTLLVLSLVALKVKLSPQQFEKVKEILDEQSINFIRTTTPDIRVREVLSSLIETYVTKSLSQ